MKARTVNELPDIDYVYRCFLPSYDHIQASLSTGIVVGGHDSAVDSDAVQLAIEDEVESLGRC